MKAKWLCMLLVALLAVACGNDDNEIPVFREVSVPTTEAMLQGAEPNGSKTEIITSAQQYREFFGTASVTGVNFDREALLVVYGVSTSGVERVTSRLTREENGDYGAEIYIRQNAAAVVQPWAVAYVVPRANRLVLNCYVNYGSGA